MRCEASFRKTPAPQRDCADAVGNTSLPMAFAVLVSTPRSSQHHSAFRMDSPFLCPKAA